VQGLPGRVCKLRRISASLLGWPAPALGAETLGYESFAQHQRGASARAKHRGSDPRPNVFVVCSSFFYPRPRSTRLIRVFDVEVNQVVEDLDVAHSYTCVIG